ncbi:hypothetical protein YC2023_056115 [Brassica napus]
MDDREGSFVAVRRISQGLERGSVYNSSSAEGVPGSAAWLGRGLSCVCAQRRDSDTNSTFDLTPAQEECLQSLQNRIDVAYDSTIPLHQEALRDLWKLAFPEEELHGLISEQSVFKMALAFCAMARGALRRRLHRHVPPRRGWVPGGGFISLENLLYFARNFQKSFQDLLRKQVGDRSVWEYPFAVAGINLTFMLIQMLDLEAVKPRTAVGATFLKFLSENESAFDLLYCIAFKLMDQQWLSMRASYMEFNTVMKSTRRQLERELMLEDIMHLEDLPSYALLSQ